MDELHEHIRQAVAAAAEDGQKLAAFHYEVLANAAQLEPADAERFCVAVGVPASYATEFRKMLALARLIRERGVTLG